MTIHKFTPARLPRKVLPLAAALLLAGLPLLARQELSRPSDSSDFGPAADVAVPQEFVAPSEPSAPSDPGVSSEPSDPGVSSEPSTPSEDLSTEPVLVSQQRSRPSDSSDTGRTAHESSHGSSSPSPSSPPSTSSGGSSSSSSSGRTAHPTSPGANEPHRQPPSRGSRGHSGSFHGGGGFYYPYGYYGPYGYWPGFYWWGGWDYPYSYPYGYGRGPGYYGRDNLGALDLDVSPGRTEVYVDGQYLGKVDRYDGWPGYLWLPRGTYDIVFYLDGYKTIARQVTVYPGTVLDFDDRMEPGPSTRPEDLASKSHERRDSRLEYERERGERIERGEPGDDESWRDRVGRERGTTEDEDYENGRGGMDQGGEARGRLQLDVEPEDASVYVDGRFVGTGTDLGMMRGGLPLAPGEHRLAVVRPGHKAQERDFRVEPGKEIRLDVELEAD
jgi:hypothetical protein